MGPDCPQLAWAASGAMALTGRPDGAPVLAPPGLMSLLARFLGQVELLSGQLGHAVRLDAGELLSGRAGSVGLARSGQVSVGGAARLLRTADGWCAVSLSRPDDVASVGAIVSGDPGGDPWTQLSAYAARRPGTEVADRAQLLGVPAAALGWVAADDPPWQRRRIAEHAPASLAGALVVDLSSLWAGPLCAKVLGLAGADVLKVESVSRPDGARSGDPLFYEWLHDGHRNVALDFASQSGRAELRELLESADVVIEGSRPRALAQLGLGVDDLVHRAGKVWLSITGYGRERGDLVAFGDDAAVAGGLVGWDEGRPVFCADAVADPLTGLVASLAALTALAEGGGALLDVAMARVAAAFAGGPAGCAAQHVVVRKGSGWSVSCNADGGRTQEVLPPRRLS